MDRILPFILANITGYPRQKIIKGVNFEWSSKLWTHNIFRIYELIFWRKEGIKAEMSYANGVYACHSWESVIALTEQYIRAFLTNFRFVPFKIYVPLLMTPQGMPVFASPYLFAIALDNTPGGMGTGSTGTSITISFTCTGSNLFLLAPEVGPVVASQNVTGITYNAVALTQIGTGQRSPSDRFFGMWYLVGPSTGANNLVTSMPANAQGTTQMVASYSGCAQSGQPDNSATAQTAGSGTTNSASITTVANNCWIAAIFNDATGSASVTAGVNTTVRQSNAGSEYGFVDSNMAITPAGSATLSITLGGTVSGRAYIIASIAPFIAAATVKQLSALGVG